jgi:hypothetical protein
MSATKELFASKRTVTSAIFDVLDAGDKGEAWIFTQDESDQETERRHRFADAVVSAIEDLQANFKFIKLEDLCNTHIREALPVSTAKNCSICEARKLTSGVERRRLAEEKAEGAAIKTGKVLE